MIELVCGDFAKVIEQMPYTHPIAHGRRTREEHRGSTQERMGCIRTTEVVWWSVNEHNVVGSKVHDSLVQPLPI